jgi:hypothetical protein
VHVLRLPGRLVLALLLGLALAAATLTGLTLASADTGSETAWCPPAGPRGPDTGPSECSWPGP